jgi:branched-chain amino acid transport system permease protein
MQVGGLELPQKSRRNLFLGTPGVLVLAGSGWGLQDPVAATCRYHARPVFEKFLQTLMDAVAVGSLYALIALGYTMVYGILKFINFAHSDVFVLGAWTSYAAALATGFADTDPNQAGIQHSTIPHWIPIGLGVVAGASLAVLTWEYVWAKRAGRPGGGLGSGRGATMGLAALWGWATLGLVLVTRWLEFGQGMRLAAGLLVLLTAMSTCGLVGFSVERLAYKPLRKAPRLNVLITAIGVSLLLQNVGQLDWMFGTRPQPIPPILPDRVLAQIGGWDGRPPVQLHLLDVTAAGTAVVLMILLDFLVFRTKLGRAMRAVSFNEKTAALMGIPVDRVISFTFILGASLAAAAGFLYAQKYSGLNQTGAATWVLLGLKAFVAAVVGGIGNIRGAMLGGILIGLLEFFGMAYISTELRDVYVFAALIIVLLVKPSGLLGSAVGDKV